MATNDDQTTVKLRANDGEPTPEPTPERVVFNNWLSTTALAIVYISLWLMLTHYAHENPIEICKESQRIPKDPFDSHYIQ